MEIRNILIDLNGCITGLPTFGFYQKGLWGLAQLAKLTLDENQFIMGACSGREMPYVRAILHMLGDQRTYPKGWSVCESGLGIFNMAEEKWIPNPVLTPEIRKAFEEDVIKVRVPNILSRHPKDLRLYKGNEINVALELTNETTLTIAKLHEETEQELRDLIDKGLVTIHHSTDTEDISPPGIDKGGGVIQIEKQTGIPHTQTLGIGDTNGDRPMLEIVSFVGCPANASSECKALVRTKGKNGYISPYSYAEGVVDIICHFTGASLH